MAHNIAKTNGQDAFVSVKEIAWHKLGKVVDKKMTSAECIKLAGLDYEVGLIQSYGKISEDNYSPIPGIFATTRLDTNEIFGVVGNRYTVVQNIEAFSFFDAIVGEGAAIYETAGALGKGERIFITAKLPDDIMVGKDCINLYLFMTNAHDGSGAVICAFTPVRIVCANTLQMALRQMRKSISIRHTAGVGQRLKDAHKLMAITARNAQIMEKSLNEMSKVRITDAELRRFIEIAMMPPKEEITKEDFSTRFTNIVDEVLQYAASHPSQLTRETKGTLYGALNAVTGYFQNVKDYKSDEKKLSSIIYGTARRKSALAMNYALDALSNQSILS